MADSLDLGGSGGASFSFGAQGSQPGIFVVGKVLALAEVQSTDYHTGKPETWDNGDPKMQYRVTLQTDLRDPAIPTDAGVREVYLDGARKARDNGTKSRLAAVLDAVRATTGGTSLAVGGFLKVQWISGMGYSGDPRNYEAMYQAPSVELGGQPAAAQQVAPGTPADPFPAHSAPAYQAPPASWVTQAVANAPGLAPGVLSPAVQNPVQNPQAVQTEQGPVNPQTGEIAPVTVPAGPVITAEAVAAVKAGGMDPAQVWPGVDLTPFGG